MSIEGLVARDLALVLASASGRRSIGCCASVFYWWWPDLVSGLV